MAVQLPIFDSIHSVVQKVGHTLTHTLADIRDDVLVRRLQLRECVDQLIVLLQQLDLMRLISDYTVTLSDNRAISQSVNAYSALENFPTLLKHLLVHF